VKILFILILIIHIPTIYPDELDTISVQQVIKTLVKNQEKVNLSYDAIATITFHTIEGDTKSVRRVYSRYFVDKGRIIKGIRLNTENKRKSPTDFPRYKENDILPLFSPLSWDAIPYYHFYYQKDTTINGNECMTVKYFPIKRLKDLSFGYVWISKKDTDLVALEMTASIPFTFTEYFTMKMYYIKLDSLWVPDEINTELLINFLGIYKRIVTFDQKVIKRYIK